MNELALKEQIAMEDAAKNKIEEFDEHGQFILED